MKTSDPLTPTAEPLNAQDPLAQLADIHLPEPIGLWPPAWGWWLVVLIALAVSAFLILSIRRKRSRNAYRALALAELNSLLARHGSKPGSDYLQALSLLLRRTALSGFGGTFNVSLKGLAWLQWLEQQCPEAGVQFSQGLGTALLTGPYQKNPDLDCQGLHQLCHLWISQHRAPRSSVFAQIAQKIRATLTKKPAAKLNHDTAEHSLTHPSIKMADTKKAPSDV